MVFENFLLKNTTKKRYVFLLTILYSIIGIIIANLVFASSSGIISVVFVAFLLMPSIKKLVRDTEEQEEKEKKFTLKKMWNANKKTLIVYSIVFIGVFLSYLMFSFLLPQFGIDVINILEEQLFIDKSLVGGAFYTDVFWSILSNNWVVLVVCFLLGLIAGDGALFFVIWNASTWGTIFGYRALTASVVSGTDPWLYLIIILSIVIWHVIVEGLAYIIAATSGSTLSNSVVSKTSHKPMFVVYFIFGGALTLFLSSMISFDSVFLTILLSMIIFMTWIYFMTFIFEEKKYKLVFTYNYWLLITAIIIFILGALLETYVLSTSTTLMQINTYAYMNA